MSPGSWEASRTLSSCSEPDAGSRCAPGSSSRGLCCLVAGARAPVPDATVSDAIVAGIDVATQEARVVCTDGRGAVLAEAAAALPAPRRPAPGCSEQDAGSWWPAVADALRHATGLLGADRARLVAVASATTSGTLVLADGDGTPIAPALMYDDARATEEAARAQELGSARWDTCGLRIGPSFALAKLAWLAARPRGLERAVHAWSAADLVVARLLGEPGPTDWSHALKTGYDLVRGEWPTDVLEGLGIPPALLPEVRPPATSAGRVCARAARETGLPEGCEVRLGMTDGCAGQLAGGAASPGRFVSVLGTTLVIKGVTRRLIRDPDGAVYSHLHPQGWWLPGGASNTGGEALRRFAPASLRALDRAAAAHGPAHCVSYPLTRTGERFPFLEQDAEGFMLGDPAGETEAYRATLEGVAFVERLAFERLASLGAAPAGAVATAGGGSRSRVWNRIRATALDRPLVVTGTPTTAFGAAMLAAAGTIHETLGDAAAAMVVLREQIEPERKEIAALMESYGRFVAELRKRGWIADVARPPTAKRP